MSVISQEDLESLFAAAAKYCGIKEAEDSARDDGLVSFTESIRRAFKLPKAVPANEPEPDSDEELAIMCVFSAIYSVIGHNGRESCDLAKAALDIGGWKKAVTSQEDLEFIAKRCVESEIEQSQYKPTDEKGRKRNLKEALERKLKTSIFSNGHYAHADFPDARIAISYDEHEKNKDINYCNIELLLGYVFWNPSIRLMLSENLSRSLSRSYSRTVSEPGYMEVRGGINYRDQYKTASVHGSISSGMRDSSGFAFLGSAKGSYLNCPERAIHIKVNNHLRLL